ncbi:MAG: F-box-like domain-containing protein [Holosporales bacterium]
MVGASDLAEDMQSSSPICLFNKVHEELQQTILSYLDGRDAVAASLVCRQWSEHIKGLSFLRSVYDLATGTPVNREMDWQDKEGGIMAVLPAELRLHVFSFLERAELARLALVSRDWKVMAEAPSLWRALQISDRTIHIPSVSRKGLHISSKGLKGAKFSKMCSTVLVMCAGQRAASICILSVNCKKSALIRMLCHAKMKSTLSTQRV